MNKKRIAINGFGRIGRVFTRTIFENNYDINIVSINDLVPASILAHLFKYDSAHGIFQGDIRYQNDEIIINNNKIKVFNEQNPEKLPWEKLDIDIVIESTGKFKEREAAGKHLIAGAKKVIISAPTKSEDVKTIVLGINDNIISENDRILSNASCTTNCVAPMIKVLKDNYTIKNAYISTVHSYTGDQRLQDAPHSDLRRARAAAHSIVPTTTGAAKAITKIFPELKDKIGGCGIRVPVIDGSITDITCIIEENTSVEKVNNAFLKASQTNLKGILQYIDEAIVSVDIIGNSHSCIFDAGLTSVIGNMIKIMGWYDNETGYSHRLADLILKLP